MIQVESRMCCSRTGACALPFEALEEDSMKTFRRRLAAAAMLLSTAACSKAPKVPHVIQDRADASCLSCHKDGINGAPKTPHPSKANCLGCHES
jgi:cytochrome c5